MSSLSVMLLDTEPQTNNFYITLAIRDALQAHPRVGRVVLGSHADAVRRMQEERFDVFLAFGGAFRHHPLLRRLCALAGTSVLWTTEDPYESRSNVAFSDCFDLVFSNDRSTLARYDGRAAHLPLAASPSFQDFAVRERDSDYRYDLLFVGTAWPNRVETINRILGSFSSSLKVKIALPWNQYIDRPQLVRSDILFDWKCGNEDFARFANMSRVVLTLTRAFSASAAEHASGTTPPPRLFEVALAGGAQLVVNPDEEILDYYRDGEEIRICRDERQVVRDIESMLGDPEKRIAMARHARARTLNQHLYTHRIDAILDAVQTSRKASSPSAPARSRPRILFVAHNRVGQRPSGGVEFYQEQLAQALTDYEIVFLYPGRDQEGAILKVDDGDEEIVIPIGSADRLLADSEIESHFQRVLSERRIDLVHFQHLLGLPLSLPLIARAYGVPTVFQVHDYYLICSRFNLVNHRGVFCDVAHRGNQQCDGCLLTAETIPTGSKARRNGFVATMIGSIDAFVASTPYSADYLSAFYPESAGKRFDLIEMIDFGAAPFSIPAAGEGGQPETRFRIAVLGNIVDHKGAKTLIELIRMVRGQGYVFEIFGYVEIYLVEQFNALAGDEVRIRGGYNQEEVPELLRGCQASLHLSIWPETYMISLTEAWRARVVPIVTDLGAPGERVTDGVDGLKVAPHEASEVLKALRRLRYDAELGRRLRTNIALKAFPTVKEHAGRFAALYEDLLRRHPLPQADLEDRSLPFNLTTFDVGVRLNAPDWTSGLNIWDAQLDRGHQPEAALSTTLPAGMDRPEKEVPADTPGLSWRLSEIVVDGQSLGGRVDDPAVADRLSLQGWAWNPGEELPEQLVLRIRPETGSPRFAETGQTVRPDLATHLGDPRAVRSGFVADFVIHDLPAGSYAVDLLGLTPSHVLVMRDVLRFRATGAPAWTPRTRWSAPEPVSDTRAAGPEGVAVERHSLEEMSGTAVARQGSVFRLGLRWPAGPGAAEPFQVGLRRLDIVSWLDATIHDGDGQGIVWAEARVEGLEAGSYRLVARAGGRDGAVVDCHCPVFVTATPQAYLLLEAPPPGLSSPRTWKKGSRLNLDLVEILDRAPHFDGATAVRVEGWSFASGYGRPVSCVASWTLGRDRRFMVVRSFHRQEVAAHLADPDAVTSGFRVELPLEAIATGRVSFTQVYERGVVTFPSFRRDVALRLGTDTRLRGARSGRRSLLMPLLRYGREHTALGRHLDLWAAARTKRRQSERALIARSGIFQPDWYAAQGRSAADPILDYVLYGAKEGLNPHPLFDTNWYLRRYRDVAADGINPFVHYLESGWREGREPGPLFCSRWYMEQHPEIAQSSLDPLAYYVRTGAGRGDATTPYFDVRLYREAHPEIAAEGGEFEHFLRKGFPAGEHPSAFYETSSEQHDQAIFPFRHWRHRDEAPRVPAADARKPLASLDGLRIAVIAHVFYPDLWPQLVSACRTIPVAFDLFVTCPEDRFEDVGALVRRDFPDAQMIATANRGRDIAPFFHALKIAEASADYDAICKIHTKRGTTEPATWRHLLLDSVLGSPEIVSDILRGFAERPALGLVGSKELYLSGPLYSAAAAAELQAITDSVFPGTEIPERWGFVAGSMFWVRPEWLRPLRLHVESKVDFEEDSTRADGQIAHALERMVGLAASLDGVEIGLVDSLPDLPIPQALIIHAAPATPRDERPEVYLARKSAEFRSRGFRPKPRKDARKPS